jgi:hypothetical protein
MIANARTPREDDFDPTKGVRVGEAGNPGPGRVISIDRATSTAASYGDWTPARSAASRSLHSDRATRPASKPELFQLRATTANGTCWPSIRSYLEACDANVVCAQEHRLAAVDAISGAEAWCRRNGWQSVWAAAKPSDQDGEASGGTAIFARTGLGLVDANGRLESTHRRVAGTIDVPNGRRTLIVSAYFRCSIGLKGENAELMASIGSCVDLFGGPALVGADFQVPPEVLEASRAAATLLAGGKIVAPVAPRGTCSNGGPNEGRTIDYFIATPDFASCVQEVTVDYNSGWHRIDR